MGRIRDELERALKRILALPPPGVGRPGRAEIMDVAFEFAARSLLEGSYLEFGCFDGTSFVRAHTAYRRWSRFAKERGLPLRYQRMFAFDSFQGLPDLTPEDRLEGYDAVQAGLFRCEQAVFRENLRAAGIDLAGLVVVPGPYAETLREDAKERLAIPPAAVVHVDCDLYSSATLALEFVTDLVQDGTLLLFDDYFLFRGNPGHGVRRALEEWLGRTGFGATDYTSFGWAGKAFIVHPGGRS